MKRKLLLATVVAAGGLMGGLSNAAPAQPAWTGAYAGVELGGAWTHDKMEVDPGSPPLDLVILNGSGFVGGAFAGYDWRLNNGVVIGGEADFEGTSISPATNSYQTWDPFAGVPLGSIVTGEARTKTSLPWQGSVRARLGYASGDYLVYATGGYAYAQMNTRYSWIGQNLPGDAFSHTLNGWTGGVGAEYAFSPGWVARAEYRYTSFDAWTDPLRHSPLGSNCCNPAQHHLDENALRVGVAYQFGPL